MKVLLLVEAPDSGLTPGWRGGIRWTGVAESVRKMVAQAYYDYKESAIRCHVLAVQAGVHALALSRRGSEGVHPCAGGSRGGHPHARPQTASDHHYRTTTAT